MEEGGEWSDSVEAVETLLQRHEQFEKMLSSHQDRFDAIKRITLVGGVFGGGVWGECLGGYFLLGVLWGLFYWGIFLGLFYWGFYGVFFVQWACFCGGGLFFKGFLWKVCFFCVRGLCVLVLGFFVCL